MLKQPDEQTVVLTKDLSEQPATPLFVAHDGECLAIDDFEVNEIVFIGYRIFPTADGPVRKIVTAFPHRDTWMVYNREYLDLVPRDRLNTRQLEAAKYNARLLKQLGKIKEKEGAANGEGMGLYA